MGPAQILTELERRGVELALDGNRLRFRPREAVTPDLRAAMAEHKDDLVRLVAAEDHEINWRVDAMRQQATPRGLIPFLVARRNLPDALGRCLSCGEDLVEGRRFRCGACVRAVERVLNEAREGT